MERKPVRLAAPLAALLMLVSGGLASAAEPPQAFLAEAIKGDIGEVQLGQLAQRKGASKEVRDYGETLAEDHAMALDKATDVARQIGMTDVPKQTSQMKQQTFDRLSQLSGEEFDRAFVATMIEDHKKDIAKFEEQAKNSDSQPVATLAENTLPALRKHLDIAQSIS